MSPLNPKAPLKHPQTQSCLPLLNQANPGYRISGKEIEVRSSARFLFLIQNCMALPPGMPVGDRLHPFKPCGQDPMLLPHSQEASPSPAARSGALHSCYVLHFCFFLSHVVKRAPSVLPNHLVKSRRWLPGLGLSPGTIFLITPFLTPPTLAYTRQWSGFFCLSPLPLLVRASVAP